MKFLLPLLLAVSSFAQTPDVHYTGTLPAIDQDWGSIMIGGHDYRANASTPVGSSVSTGSVFALGWTTPDDTSCPFCSPWNQQNILVLSMKNMSAVRPSVNLSLVSNPGVDDFKGGVWAFNVATSNAFKRNGKGTILGGEINIGLDDFAVDAPNPGQPGQSIGLTITESSQNKTGKRVSTAWGMGYGGTQNFHHGWWADANPNGQTPMDDLIHARGPITTVFDLSQVKSGPVAIAMPPNGGLALGIVQQASALPKATPPGTIYLCLKCARNSEPCAAGTTQALAVSTGPSYRCN